jgi:hypothetical protein
VLNLYAHPNLPLGGTPPTPDHPQGQMEEGLEKKHFEDPERFNFPIFQCPGDDNYNYQERYWGTGVLYGNSAYHAIGNSYLFNLAWVDWAFNYPEFASPVRWELGARYFNRARLEYPSRYVAFWDDPGDWGIIRRRDTDVTHHGGLNRFAMGFLDGHAGIITYDYNDPYDEQHTVLFFEQMKR